MAFRTRLMRAPNPTASLFPQYQYMMAFSIWNTCWILPYMNTHVESCHVWIYMLSLVMYEYKCWTLPYVNTHVEPCHVWIHMLNHARYQYTNLPTKCCFSLSESLRGNLILLTERKWNGGKSKFGFGCFGKTLREDYIYFTCHSSSIS